MRRILCILLMFTLLLSQGCSSNRYTKYSYELIGAFDTMIQFMGYWESKDEFNSFTDYAEGRLREMHMQFDIYNDYDNINNIKTINDNAGIKPIKVDQIIIDVINFSIDWHDKTGGSVNIALGPVLKVWKEYRDKGSFDSNMARLPDIKLLKEKALLTDIKKIEIDQDNQTVFLKEKGMSLDVGSVAKGYATQIVTQELKDKGYDSFLISSGGNVMAAGEPKDGIRTKWGIGIQEPNGNPLIPNRDTLDIAYVSDLSVVTSGDYQRFYVVDQKRIHHLIDVKTLMPANYFRAVTVISPDSGVADFLSTAVFLLPYEESSALIESVDDAEALWVFDDGTIKTTPGMEVLLKEIGGAENTKN